MTESGSSISPDPVFALTLGLNSTLVVTGTDYPHKHSFSVNYYRTSYSFSKVYTMSFNDYF